MFSYVTIANWRARVSFVVGQVAFKSLTVKYYSQADMRRYILACGAGENSANPMRLNSIFNQVALSDVCLSRFVYFTDSALMAVVCESFLCQRIRTFFFCVFL